MWDDALARTRAYLIDALLARGLDVPVGTTVPDPRPGRFVRLVDSGSERRTLVHRDSRVTVEAWNAGGEAAAVADAEVVYDVLDSWELVPAFGGFPSGPYAQPDPDTGTPRVVMTCIVRHRSET